MIGELCVLEGILGLTDKHSTLLSYFFINYEKTLKMEKYGEGCNFPSLTSLN